MTKSIKYKLKLLRRKIESNFNGLNVKKTYKSNYKGED